MSFIKIKCFAKINLYLGVTRKKENYHQIESIFHTISLYDELSITINKNGEPFCLKFLKRDEPRLPIKTKNYNLKKNNLLEKIFLYFQKKYKIPPLTLELKKNIPIGAGLGGGSSDAAGLISGLNQLFKLNLSLLEKQKIAKQFGSDIPYFFTGGFALVEGIGEKVTKINFSLKKKIILIYPNIFIATAQAYNENVIIKKKTNFFFLKNKIINLNQQKNIKDFEIKFITKLIFNSLFNSFQEKTLINYKKIAKIFSIIRPHTNKILLSGSGSSIFSSFNDIITLNNIFFQLKKNLKYVYKVHLVDQGILIKNESKKISL